VSIKTKAQWKYSWLSKLICNSTFANESDEVATIYNSFTPAYYVNYFRVMAQMARENGGKLTQEIATEVMSRYATLQTKNMGESF
jgi:hypothetical protein